MSADTESEEVFLALARAAFDFDRTELVPRAELIALIVNPNNVKSSRFGLRRDGRHPGRHSRFWLADGSRDGHQQRSDGVGRVECEIRGVILRGAGAAARCCQ